MGRRRPGEQDDAQIPSHATTAVHDGHEALGLELARVLDAVVARLIPSDESGPGAREAGVSTYIERSLAGDYVVHVPAYRLGLKAVDARATAHYGRPFLALGSELQDAVLGDFDQGKAGDDGKGFFELVRQHSLEGMFGDPSWGGNRDYAGWRLLGYPGPRLQWRPEDQRLDIVIPPGWGNQNSRPVTGRHSGRRVG